jgi:SAM-dependent methyltransferase
MRQQQPKVLGFSWEAIKIVRSLLSRNPLFDIRQLRAYPSWQQSEKKFVNRYAKDMVGCELSVDLGCGNLPNNLFNAQSCFGIDMAPYDGVYQADLAIEGLPFDSSSVDVITAFDFIEHIPRHAFKGGSSVYPFIALMSEVYRVLKPGGFLFHRTPAYPAKEAFQDPTHTNIITEDTFPRYFCGAHSYANNYGFVGNFKIVKQSWIKSSHVIGLLKAVK